MQLLVCFSRTEIDELNKEIISVKESYIAVCKEKDEQEAIMKASFEREQQLKEEKVDAKIFNVNPSFKFTIEGMIAEQLHYRWTL